MTYEISLTANRNTETEDADNFIGLMTSHGFSVIQGETRNQYNGDKVYIRFTISPIMFAPPVSNKGGRPRKLTDEQIEEIKPDLPSLTATSRHLPGSMECPIRRYINLSDNYTN